MNVKSLVSFWGLFVEFFESVEGTLGDFLNLSGGEDFVSIFIEGFDETGREDSGFNIELLVESDLVWEGAHYWLLIFTNFYIFIFYFQVDPTI